MTTEARCFMDNFLHCIESVGSPCVALYRTWQLPYFDCVLSAAARNAHLVMPVLIQDTPLTILLPS